MRFHHSILASLQLSLLPASVRMENDAVYALVRGESGGLQLAIAAPRDSMKLKTFRGEWFDSLGQRVFLGALDAHNAAALRRRFDWLKPRPLGLATSAGMGDRLGLATPGHIRALRAAGRRIAPIFAQQSIREMGRTGRTPQQVMDAATWGMFAEGWTEGAGADADHLKTPQDIDACLAAGFTFFTIDPGSQVDDRAAFADLSGLRELAEALPREMGPAASGLLNRKFNLEGLKLAFDEATLLRAAAKYGRAVAHVASMYHHLEGAAGARPFELEVSVDETEQPTSHAEHLYIASELKRLGVKWVSLAPRYVGRFEKGVDYIGDLDAFQQDIAGHAAIARKLGPYKLSLHSGSDKFSIYPLVMQAARGLVHLKTAGTSYLEALRTVAALDEEFFRELYQFARDRYETDKASYHVSAELGRAPRPEEVEDWPALLDQFDAREIMHVTFGSVLTASLPDGSPRFSERLMELLRQHSEAYAGNLKKHFLRHLLPFTKETLK
jgi:hypothetical protein